MQGRGNSVYKTPKEGKSFLVFQRREEDDMPGV